jgi:hypothetical protein
MISTQQTNVYSMPLTIYLSMNSTKLNGVNTQQLGSLMNTLKVIPDASKATFLSRQNGTVKKKVVVDFVLDLQPKTLKLVANLSKEIAVTQLLWTFLQNSQEKARVLQYARLVCLA